LSFELIQLGRQSSQLILIIGLIDFERLPEATDMLLRCLDFEPGLLNLRVEIVQLVLQLRQLAAGLVIGP